MSIHLQPLSGPLSVPIPTGVEEGEAISFRNIGVSYADARGEPVAAIAGLDLQIEPGTFVSIVGPSGCGKSTLLRVLAGLVTPVTGEALIGGQPAAGTARRLGFMFQRDTLLPWATVADNIRVGTDLAGLAPAAARARLAELVEFIRLQGFENHRPHQLSGGMRQRVSLGRLLAYEPDIYLMDEPFGALDSQTKSAMGRELLRIWAKFRRTVIFVTHDIEEAVTLSDRVVVMAARPGRIVLDQRIDLPRPRDARTLRKDPKYRDLVDVIWQHIETP
ncbi:ABC transporter ATP-binding protein [Sinirhodobacter populi]|uniref:ABC transporter ATP-binding protein n=1 Tax=Paenirhodobacter populi TaxID=2306993 RepID=A0A443K4I2_9RHOB|nr:ABC transporter ATP-binding protein [Sinirhodobacter populi]RWR27688.1 ABC transporter ATP-binding protein [Sinirhodobacter populi]